MKRLVLLLFFMIFYFPAMQVLMAQVAPVKLWDKTFGGNCLDDLYSIIQISDGGYFAGGGSCSGLSIDKSQPNFGLYDYWVIKLDANGNKVWDKAFGSSGYDYLQSMQQTADKGFILGGYSDSGISSGKSEDCKGGWDYWIVKLDSSGTKIWDKTFGGTGYDKLIGLQQTLDGGYVLGGLSDSGIGGDKSEPLQGMVDYWVVKIDANGNMVWEKSYGGTGRDEFGAIQQTFDGGYILGGQSNSGISGDKSQASKGAEDFWIIKLDAFGNKVWDKTIGGNSKEGLRSLQQTFDGGYFLGGSSNSGISGDKTDASKGSTDYWVIKLDSSGNTIWDKSLGGSNADQLNFLSQTSDGGYILGGDSHSGISGDRSQPSQGGADIWLIKLDANGNKMWDKSLGGNGDDFLSEVRQVSNKEYILGGLSNSNISGDKSQTGKGGWDYWIVKLAAPCSDLTANLKASCSGGSAALYLNVSGVQYTSGVYSWSLTYTVNGIIQIATGTSPNFILAQNPLPGSVYSLVNITSGTCSTNLNQSITIQSIPSAPTGIPGKICESGTITLSANGAPVGGNYVWYDAATGGTALQTDTSRVFITPDLTATTTYYVAATNNAGCEGPRTPVTATITTVLVNAGKNDSVCVSSPPFQLNGFSPSGGVWSGAGVSTSGVFMPTDSLIGLQSLTYTVIQNGCTFTAIKLVTVIKPAALGPDIEACEGEEITLRSKSITGNFLWNDGSANQFLKINKSGKYWLKLIQENCTTTDTIQVTFKTCPEPFIPNIVTLNNDGRNDTFQPQNLPKGIWHLQIFNRWGSKIYETGDYQGNWPDKKISNGVYYYLLGNPETGKQFKGWVEVVE